MRIWAPLIILLLAGCAGRREARLARQAAQADPLSELSLRRYADQIIPAVEQAAGRSFQQRPVVRWLDREHVAALAADELRAVFSTVFPDVTEAYRERLAASSGASMGGLLGKYTPATHEVHLVREAFASSQLDDRGRAEVVRLVLAHELTHALQEEHSAFLGALDHIRDQDALDAWRATEEGQATWIEEQVADALGLQRAHRRMTRMQGWEPDGSLAKPEAFPIWAVYGQGRNSIDWHVTHHGQDFVWDELLPHPPARTAMVFRPQLWSAEPPADSALEGVLSGTLGLLSAGREWSAIETTLGEMKLRGEAIQTDPEALQTVLGHLLDARVRMGMLPDREAEVRVLRFDAPEWSVAYLALLRREDLTKTQALAAASGVPITLHFVPFELEDIQADASLKRVEQVPIGGGRYRETERVWIARGELAVVVTTSFRAGLRAGWAARRVFEQLDAE